MVSKKLNVNLFTLAEIKYIKNLTDLFCQEKTQNVMRAQIFLSINVA